MINQLPKILKIGTRKSPLAMLQAQKVSALFKQYNIETEIIGIETSGDKFNTQPLSEIGGKALFAKEIQKALIEDRIHLAVHSLKDLETTHPEGLCLLATLPREDPRDVFIALKGRSKEFLDENRSFVFGTCSPRRSAFMKFFWENSSITPLRGNIETRLSKVVDGVIDATILAAAGLKRMELIQKFSSVLDFVFLDLKKFTPASCQGVIGIEGKKEFSCFTDLINDQETFLTSCIERKIIAEFGGSCKSAIGIYSFREDQKMSTYKRWIDEKKGVMNFFEEQR